MPDRFGKARISACLCLLVLLLLTAGGFANTTSPNLKGVSSVEGAPASPAPPELFLVIEDAVDNVLDPANIRAAAIKYPSSEMLVLLLRPGVWKVFGELQVPVNMRLKLQEGTLLSLQYGSRMVFDGLLEAGTDQIFSGTGRVLFRHSRQDVCPQWWKSPHERFFSAAIQKALSSGARSVFFPRGIYEVDIRREDPIKSLVLQSNTRLHGEGDQSVIKLVETPKTDGVWAAHEILAGKDLENIEISRLTFDAEKYYPDPETTSRLDSAIRGTRALRLINVENCKITESSFKGFTNGSAYITGTNVVISGNRFIRASYRTQVVRLDKSKHVTVSENKFEDIGPHYYMVLGRPDETSSVDVLMVGYEVDDAHILRNEINTAAGNGIRVENSKNIHVIENTISNVGEDGIIFYRETVDCECSGNTISNWGKLNNFAFIRKQNGRIFNPREYHYPPPKFPQLPFSLRDAKTWEENRYHLQERDQFSIPEYDPQDYKGILAFRGFSAIAVTEISERIKITRNRITGNTSKTGGLYNYASNYGINIGVASINPPTTSGDCIVTENTISGCIDYDIYSPQYVDSHSKRNVQKPSFVYDNKCDPAKVVVFGNKAKGSNQP